MSTILLKAPDAPESRVSYMRFSGMVFLFQHHPAEMGTYPLGPERTWVPRRFSICSATSISTMRRPLLGCSGNRQDAALSLATRDSRSMFLSLMSLNHSGLIDQEESCAQVAITERCKMRVTFCFTFSGISAAHGETAGNSYRHARYAARRTANDVCCCEEHVYRKDVLRTARHSRVRGIGWTLHSCGTAYTLSTNNDELFWCHLYRCNVPEGPVSSFKERFMAV